MGRPLRIGLVSPRFEPVTAVGAEVQIRQLAQRLSARGHGVEVLTTCVRDPLTWKNHYHPGRVEEEGYAVTRFPADPHRVSRRFLEADRRIRRGETVSRGEEDHWAAGLGASAALVKHLGVEGEKIDVFIFSPLVCGTTFFGLPSVAPRSLLIPALPDAPEARLEIVRERLRLAPLLLAGSETERDLLLSAADLEPDRVATCAAGVDPMAEYHPRGFRQRHGIEVPFLFYTGRRSRRRGVDRLIEYASSAARNGGIDLRLVLAGEETIAIPEHARDYVLDLHFLGEQDKADGLAAALATCQPSPTEALALAPMESWLAGRPVLADARGAVTAARCRLSGGGLWYRDAFEFEEAVRLLLEDEDRAAAMGRRGRDFVLEKWSWERALGVIEEACAGLAGGRP